MLTQIAYESGSGSVPILFFFSFLTGAGSCFAFQASIKTAALNWPKHRGSATAFPLAAFGLSAFFFTSISGIAFPNSTSKYLLLLTIGTFCMSFFSTFFIRIPKSEPYTAVPASEALVVDDIEEQSSRQDSTTLHHWSRNGLKHETTKGMSDALV
jgi:hypothetical protein